MPRTMNRSFGSQIHAVAVAREQAFRDDFKASLAAARANKTEAVDPATITGARMVRDRFGWHNVIKVNRTTVTVDVEPGMDNKIPFAKIVQVHA